MRSRVASLRSVLRSDRLLRAFSADSKSCNLTPEEQKIFGAKSYYAPELTIQKDWPAIPIFRRMDKMGKFLDPNYQVKFDAPTLTKIYHTMVTLNVMDQIFYDAQRQGRISFYMTNYGEEATQVGSASALDPEDMIFAQYREAGVLMWRGFTLENFANQCFSTSLDLGKGRQMPVHYGSRNLNFQTISSPLGTQIPQAAGAAYAFKREKKQNVVACYFGEGAASEGDFHAALNFAATLSCPVIFICRNNGYAISTSSRDQFRGDGIASRGAGYGMATMRVDGNDLLAMHDATQTAREMALKEGRPVLLEAMSYRAGHHSTSDDSSRYRDLEEIQFWQDNNNPISRVRLLMENMGIWDSEQETALRTRARKDVLHHLAETERKKHPARQELFTDVYQELPRHLKEQAAELEEHLKQYGQHYDLSQYEAADKYVDPSKPAK